MFETATQTSKEVRSKTRWKILSVLLSYPDHPAFEGLLADALDVSLNALDVDMAKSVNNLRHLPLPELAKVYVNAFDMNEKTSLYLTAHELGESRERGAALVKLHMILRVMGYEIETGELPDYLPALFELFAEADDDEMLHELKYRVGIVCKAIEGRLEDEHPYRSLFTLAALSLPSESQRTARFDESSTVQQSQPTLTAPCALSADHDDALPMPYPLVYD
ncbi:respiratory nitrate reductase subunit delta [Alicyclobacillus hesperidum subsp. aegles]|uniref:nitrate reductase molybdenum cofactor assembly chaperone n=1 Tax=Alicyclobacillus hesperidum TaxID=89784 RepID=UPI00071933A4|nr:nitrate reductase molybdenum cofactor assembly chaperone [Alicyclobacillus hesperidum]GLG01161.1 respiratory nitrate reductase subunit delta [Alicyclobacillus hesperidum subsp. aegles]